MPLKICRLFCALLALSLSLGPAGRRAQAQGAAGASCNTDNLSSAEVSPAVSASPPAQIEQLGWTPPALPPLATAQIARLGDLTPVAGDQFGFSVAVSGDIVVVGANTLDPPSKAHEGTEGDSGAVDAGAVFIFSRNSLAGPDSWSLVKQLFAPDLAAGDEFGFSVALSGDTLLVGAARAAVDGKVGQGAAYVFARNQGGKENWGLVTKLSHSGGAAGDQFGSAVAIDGDRLLVGAPNVEVGANSDQGAAYLFARNLGGAEQWGQVATLTATLGLAQDRLGASVSLRGDIAVAGAPNADVGVNSDRGSAHIFYRNDGGANAWDERATVLAGDGAAGDQFGSAVAVSGDTLLVGAPRSGAGSISDQGAAYIYTRNQGGTNSWGQRRKLVGRAPGDEFGFSVALSGDTGLVGARVADVSGALNQGAAYLVERNQGGADQWGTLIRLTAPDGGGGDTLGYAVAVDGAIMVAGAPLASPGGLEHAGSASVFYRGGPRWQQLSMLASGSAGAKLGHAIALENDTLVVGAPYSDKAGADSGVVYLYERNVEGADAWNLLAELAPPDGAAGDHFGRAVAISDDTVIVGAPDRAGGQGAAYIFLRNLPAADGWGWKATLNGSPGDRFGSAVAISGDLAAVGAPTAVSTGTVALYERNQGGADAWGRLAGLSIGASGDQFGAAVALENDTLVVGAPSADPLDRADAGSAYLFERNSGGPDRWGLVTQLSPDTIRAGDHFGLSVALDNETVLVGAPDADRLSVADVGEATLFARNQAGADCWKEQALLWDPQGAELDRFGFAVALHGDTALIGAPRVQSGENANQGAGVIFARNHGGRDAWGWRQRLVAAAGQPEDRLGFSVALGSELLAMGAINVDVGDAGDHGAAYLFRRAAYTVHLPLLLQ